MNSTGSVEWFRTYGGPHYDNLGPITESKEGGFLLWGETRSLFFTPLPGRDTDLKSLLVKADEAGVAEWSQEIRSVPTSLIQTEEGSYVLAGAAYMRGNDDLSLVRFDQAGRHIWQWTYRSPDPNSFEGATGMAGLPDGGFMLIGSSSGSSKRWILGSPLLIRVGADGELQRSQRLDGVVGRMRQIIRSQDGFAILGSVGEEDEILLVRTDAEGNLLWANSYGGHDDDKAYSIIEDSRGLFVIGGATKSSGQGDWDGMLMGVRNNGEIAYCLTIGSADTDLIKYVQEAENHQLFVVGDTAGMGPGLLDVFLAAGRSKEGGLWQACEDEIKVLPIDLQPREFQLIGERGGIKVRMVPTALQIRPWATGLRESEFPVLPESP
jgi:hypothetical protein